MSRQEFLESIKDGAIEGWKTHRILPSITGAQGALESADGTSTDWRKQNYAEVIGETDYKKAAQALKDAGYATDPDYPSKLISIIEQNNLVEWDRVALVETNDAQKIEEGIYTLDGETFQVEEIEEDN